MKDQRGTEACAQQAAIKRQNRLLRADRIAKLLQAGETLATIGLRLGMRHGGMSYRKLQYEIEWARLFRATHIPPAVQ